MFWCIYISFHFVNIDCSQIMLIDNLYWMFRFHMCSSEIYNSFMENKTNNETQIENISTSANRTKSHDPKSSQGQQTLGLQVSRNSWMMFAALPTLFLGKCLWLLKGISSVRYDMSPTTKGCYKIPYWKN